MEVYNFVVACLGEIKTEIFLGLLIFVLLSKGSKSLHNRPNIPGPYPWPLIGNALSLGKHPHIAMQSMAEKYGPLYLMKVGGFDVVVLNDYDTIKEALERQCKVFAGRPQFESFANISQGKGIAFNSPLTQGDDWNSPDGVVEPESTINISIANIICALLWGNRYDYNNEEIQYLVSVNLEFGNVVGAGSQIDVMPWIKIFPPFRQTMKTFNSYTEQMNNWMLMRAKEHRKNFTYGITRSLVDTFISESLNCPNTILKDDIIMALASDFFGASQDTLTTAVEWMLCYMMYFPSVQKKIHAEIDGVLGNESLPNIFDMKLFPYTEAVMHEILRHSSFTSTTIPHKTTKNTTLGGYCIPKDMLVFVNQFAANHDPRYWDKPDEFQPERFLNKNGQVIPKANQKYLMFSTGSRKCPGDELTRELLKNLMMILFTLCEFQSDSKKPPSLETFCSLSLRPKELRTRLHIRKPEIFENLVTRLS